MNTFTRRSFLKGVLSLAASFAIPVELVEQAAKLIETIPNEPITRKNPAGYIRINELLVPVASLNIDTVYPEPRFMFDGWSGKSFRIDKRHDESHTDIQFTTYQKLPRYLLESSIKFAVTNEYLPFEVAGTGLFTSYSYDSIMISDENWNYTYDLSVNSLDRVIR
jgi:hypothetical protein